MKPESTGDLNLRWALTLIDALAAGGVRHAVVSPGARSTPLALACARHPGITMHVVLDERAAGFFALGLAKAEGMPAVVIATSGSAPANWHPAVIEAGAGQIPLLLLSADRPPELRDCGANQSIDQLKLFGGQVRFFHEAATPDGDPALFRQLAALGRDAVNRSRTPLPGPVHLNLPFREPLMPTAELAFTPSARLPAALPRWLPDPGAVARLAESLSGQPGLIVCGGAVYPNDFPAALTSLAERLGCPVLADPLANLRFGAHSRRHICVRHAAWLRGNPPKPAWILRFGAMPVSRPVLQLVAGQEARQFLVSAHGERLDATHRAELIHADPALFCQALAALPLEPAPPDWLAGFAAAEERAAAAAHRHAPAEARILATLLDALPPGAQVLCGNSMPIRDLDDFSGSAAKPLRIFANRGASGIDGNLASAAGLAAAGCGKTVALLGDLAATHDAGALLAARGLDLTIVVLNNGGGGIFSYLPQAGLAEFRQLWQTPQHLDFSALAQAYGVAYARAANPEEFAAVLPAALDSGATTLIEVLIDQDASVAAHRAYWQAAVKPGA